MEEDLVWTLQPRDSARWVRAGGGNILSRRAILFNEQGGGTYVGSVRVAPGASILDVAVFCLAGPWKKGSAHLHVGDGAHPNDGYIPNLDLVNVFNVPYDNESPTHGADWSDPNISGGVYGQAANWYAAGNAVYTPTVRYPNGAVITATIVAIEGGPIVALDTNDPDGFPGVGYAPGDTGHILQGSNNSATYRVDTVDGGGAVTAWTITDPGDEYFVDVGLNTDTDGGGTFLTFNLTEIQPPVGPIVDPGSVVVDVIGFGVPVGPTILPVPE